MKNTSENNIGKQHRKQTQGKTHEHTYDNNRKHTLENNIGQTHNKNTYERT